MPDCLSGYQGSIPYSIVGFLKFFYIILKIIVLICLFDKIIYLFSEILLFLKTNSEDPHYTYLLFYLFYIFSKMRLLVCTLSIYFRKCIETKTISKRSFYIYDLMVLFFTSQYLSIKIKKRSKKNEKKTNENPVYVF